MRVWMLNFEAQKSRCSSKESKWRSHMRRQRIGARGGYWDDHLKMSLRESSSIEREIRAVLDKIREWDPKSGQCCNRSSHHLCFLSKWAEKDEASGRVHR